MLSRRLCYAALFCVLAATALAQSPAAEPIVANQNRVPAGRLENGILTVHLELRRGAWHPEADDGPTLFVQAFGEAGRPAEIPGPLVRMPVGTTVHVTVTNKLKTKATVYGLNTRPGDAKEAVELAAEESRDLSFVAGAPGTYYYWARTSDKFPKALPLLEDAQLNGGFIVDPAGVVPADRIFVLNAMVALADVLQEGFEVLTLNGKSYPYTEPLEYTAGETIRWRVINPSFGEHPMHLHGSFYQVLSMGDFEQDTAYAEGDRQWVVTQDLLKGHSMMLEWKPEHVGRWLFHCHFQAHISADERVPMLLPPAGSKPAAKQTASGTHDHEGMGAMRDMAGLVLAINVKPAPGAGPERAATPSPHKIDLVIEPNAANAKLPAFSCSVRDGKKLVASADKSMGPPIVVTRGEATEITVLNHLTEPTTIHWHGLELDSYYDGVMGGGAGNQVTPAIAPGESFTARFTPNRAGTFIYHTHARDPNQLTDGVYGPLIVLEPEQPFDPEHDKVLVVGTRDPGFSAKRITLNGAEAPSTLILQHGVEYRLRLINMAADLGANVQLGSKEHPENWRAIAKDGAVLPSRLAKTGEATVHIASGETYDFAFEPDASGEIPLQVENPVNHEKLLAKIAVQ
jgi:FtsP/CotA-like multicopper oxidase with cupredoxin domain